MSIDQHATSHCPRLHLHLPEEPACRRQGWRTAILEGKDPSEVVGGPDGIAGWLWARWTVLDAYGMGEEAFSAVVLGYRRELWLWLVGDRVWVQCCAGLIGRVARRLAAGSSGHHARTCYG
jgi:hypothetical protein